MRDVEFYRTILGLLSPWSVSKVELSMKDTRVDIWVEHETGCLFPCPSCGEKLPLYDHAEERSWRHLDTCQLMTYLHARPPRVQCPKDGVLRVNLAWAEPHGRFTMLFERLAIDLLQEMSVEAATRILSITWDEAWGIKERAVKRGLRAKEETVCPRIGVDEKAFLKGHKYATLVTDLDGSTVEHVAEGRGKSSLDQFFTSLSRRQREGIEAVAMDMHAPYIEAVRSHLEDPDKKIVFDRFHVMGLVTRAVDLVRRREHRERTAEGDATLTGTKYVWLKNVENLTDAQSVAFDILRKADLKTGRAWAIKENLRSLWMHFRPGSAVRHWKRWYGWAIRSRLKPIIDAARSIHRHLYGVLNFYQHPITNAVSEGLNSKIQKLKQVACGFRNFENFRTTIYFHCGGLQLHPGTH